eukprot:scaffold22701_cov123-Cylindrotheca_fusiformis.AAC.7
MEPIEIPDEPRGIQVSDRVYPSEYEGHFSRILVKREEIIARAEGLARLIHADYKGKRPVLLCVLKGSNPFYMQLLEALQDLKQGYYTEFVRVSSYEGTESTGKLKVGGGLEYKHIEDKDIILVEDIVDTGHTLSNLIPKLQTEAKPKSIEVCTLLTKRLSAPAMCTAKYVGFSIPDHFVVGYGLDYNELYRDVKDIWVISQKGIDFDSKSYHT